MMSNQTTIGIDCRSDLYYIAQVQHGQSECKITDLKTVTQSDLSDNVALEGANIIMAVPDNKVVIKNLHISGAARWDRDMLAQFELSQTLLDDENEFCFAALNTGNAKRYLGIMTRRRELEQIANSLFSSLGAFARSLKYEMRAVALGKGYINFCHSEQRELVCLTDFYNNAASIAFIFEQNIIGVAFLPTGRFDPETEEGLKKMAVELKTVISFKLASFFEEGIVPPLSTLLVSGNSSDNQIINILKQHFQIAVTKPRTDNRFLAETLTVKDVVIEDYLVAMGLTVD